MIANVKINGESPLIWFLTESTWWRLALLLIIGIAGSLYCLNAKIITAPVELNPVRTHKIFMPTNVDIAEVKIENPVMRINRISPEEYINRTKGYGVQILSIREELANCLILKYYAMADTSATIVQQTEKIINSPPANIWYNNNPAKWEVKKDELIVQYNTQKSGNWLFINILTFLFTGAIMTWSCYLIDKLLKNIYLKILKKQ